jgi:hypothetical protein
MSRIQINASVGGECVPGAALKGRNCSEADSVLGRTAEDNATQVAFTLQVESDFPSGWVGFDLCSLDVAQQVLFAQERGLHDC